MAGVGEDIKSMAGKGLFYTLLVGAALTIFSGIGAGVGLAAAGYFIKTDMENSKGGGGDKKPGK